MPQVRVPLFLSSNKITVTSLFSQWVLINSTSKVFDDWIRDPHLHKKQLVSWSNDKESSSGADAINQNSLKEKHLYSVTIIFVGAIPTILSIYKI